MTVPICLYVSRSLLAVGVVGREAGGELAAVLQVEQHPRHEPRDLIRVAGPD